MPSDLPISFAYPLFLLLPLLVALALRLRPRSKLSALFPDIGPLLRAPMTWRVAGRAFLLPFLFWVFILLLSVAAARPQRVLTPHDEVQARNLMLIIDLSPSMEAADIDSSSGLVTRLAAVKKVVADFVSHQTNNRIGLVIFAGRAFLRAPLTTDYHLVKRFVDGLEVGMAGDATAIGDALGLGLKRVRDVPATSSAIILLTDGVSNAGSVDPLQAAKVARDLQIKVYTIGIGSADSNNPANWPFGLSLLGQAQQQVGYDSATLKEIAKLTHAKFFDSSSLSGLAEVYSEIDKLDTSSVRAAQPIICAEYFPEFALAALLAYLAYLALALGPFLTLP